MLNEPISKEYMKKVTVVTNRHLCERPFAEQIRRVCAMQPAGIILREKDLPEDAYTELAGRILSICREADVPLILHSYPGAARVLGLTSIHMPLPALFACAKADPQALDGFDRIGASTHSVEEAVSAANCGATYLTAGHIFSTDCKKGLAPRGTGFLRRVCANTALPVYAIGGIGFDEAQIQDMLQYGAAGVCIMSAAMRI